MQAYSPPICYQTRSPAHLFCCFPGCPLPAFACSDYCLINTQHQHTLTHQYTSIQPSLHLALSLPLSDFELKTLQRQDKQFTILSGELKLLQQSHWKKLQQCKQRLQLKGAAKKLIQAIKSKTTDTVTGGDMAEIVKLMEKNDMFANQRSVGEAIEGRNGLVEGLIEGMWGLVEEYKRKVAGQLRPEEIPQTDPVIPETVLKLAAENSKMVRCKDGVVTTHIQDLCKSYPVFAEPPLVDGRSFEVEIVDAGNRWFTIGVAPGELKNCTDDMNNADNIYIKAYGYLCCGGEQEKFKFKLYTGDKVTVVRKDNEIKWMRNGQILCKATIPKQLADKQLFPTFWLRSSNNIKQISRLRLI